MAGAERKNRKRRNWYLRQMWRRAVVAIPLALVLATRSGIGLIHGIRQVGLVAGHDHQGASRSAIIVTVGSYWLTWRLARSIYRQKPKERAKTGSLIGLVAVALLRSVLNIELDTWTAWSKANVLVTAAGMFAAVGLALILWLWNYPPFQSAPPVRLRDGTLL